MVKYAHSRSLIGSEPCKLGSLYRSKISGGHISPYSVYNLWIASDIKDYSTILCSNSLGTELSIDKDHLQYIKEIVNEITAKLIFPRVLVVDL